MNDCAKSCSGADEVIVTDIYAAREKNNGKVHSKDLVRRISQYHDGVRYADSFRRAVELVKSESKKDDLVLTMGAGDIYKVGESLIR